MSDVYCVLIIALLLLFVCCHFLFAHIYFDLVYFASWDFIGYVVGYVVVVGVIESWVD